MAGFVFCIEPLHGRPPDKSANLNGYFSYFSTKTYVVDTQKNHLKEMVVLGTQNTWLN